MNWNYSPADVCLGSIKRRGANTRRLTRVRAPPQTLGCCDGVSAQKPFETQSDNGPTSWNQISTLWLKSSLPSFLSVWLHRTSTSERWIRVFDCRRRSSGATALWRSRTPPLRRVTVRAVTTHSDHKNGRTFNDEWTIDMQLQRTTQCQNYFSESKGHRTYKSGKLCRWTSEWWTSLCPSIINVDSTL